MNDESAIQCLQPCDPDADCPLCSTYWRLMEADGYWDMANHRWTDLGWKRIVLRS